MTCRECGAAVLPIDHLGTRIDLEPHALFDTEAIPGWQERRCYQLFRGAWHPVEMPERRPRDRPLHLVHRCLGERLHRGAP